MTTHRMLPLYEAKMIHHYDHRWATYEPDGSTRDVTTDEKRDPNFVVQPRYWVRAEVVAERIGDRWDRDWLLGWRDICRSTDDRTCIAAISGAGASPEGGTLLTFCDSPEDALLVLANWNSFVFDFVARQKVGGTHLKYFTMRQLPMISREVADASPDWCTQPLKQWVGERVLALVADNVEMTALATDFGVEVNGAAWDPKQRPLIRADLDAAFFHVYGIRRDDVGYILDTFPIARRKDEAAHGEYRTKRLILEAYDRLAA
ncbi:hypothetical protein EB75_23020 [Mycobacterium sp. ST-F2]|uniref:hypothetical protein n=1 Tax=Mycobacterium sp. ST-F2 TaxID=1490484 RepID=UPI00093F2646|nr:hypothetical protein [Mycobacterium sp. ST-F2]OKH85389.1 hypothetical protein EB75_23020 [Mycobacterium sp. ST-F2]